MWTPQDPLTFGQRLALVRQRMQWNIAEAARECGCDSESWRAWEQLGRRPRDYPTVCEAISERSETDLVWLMTGRLPRRDSNLQPSGYVTGGESDDVANTPREANASDNLTTMKLAMSGLLSKRQTSGAERWLQALSAAGRGQGTINLRAYWLTRLKDETGTAPERVTREQLTAWLAAGEWNAATRRSVLATMRGFYGWAVTEGVVKTDISQGLGAPREPRPCPKPIGEADLAAALERWRDHEWVWLLRLAASTGMRRGELAKAHSDHLEEAGIRVVGKGQVTRVIPVPDDLREWIARQDGWLFPSHTGSHMLPDSVSVRLRRMTGHSAHALRHRFATVVYRETRDLRAVQVLLGHATVATTQRYVGVDAEQVSVAAARGWVA